jgi:hypothetical protein
MAANLQILSETAKYYDQKLKRRSADLKSNRTADERQSRPNSACRINL